MISSILLFIIILIYYLFESSTESKSLSVSSNALPVKDGAPRRSLNLEDYKKRRGLI